MSDAKLSRDEKPAGEAKPILVIADDLTGAAEIAGVGLACGLPTRLVREPGFNLEPGLTVIDTDSRLESPAGAVLILRQFLTGISRESLSLLYKKTDSVLRGQVLAEIEQMLLTLGFESSLLVPQNPSRQRTIARGEYRIDGVPLHETEFANDPDFPAWTSDVARLLGMSDSCTTRSLELEEAIPSFTIAVGAGERREDLDRWADSVNETTLPAGGVDFFSAIMRRRGHSTQDGSANSNPISGTMLLVCGTASGSRPATLSAARRHGVARVSMPGLLFAEPHGNSGKDHSPSDPVQDALRAWTDEVIESLTERGRVIVDIDHPVDRSRGTGRRLQQHLAALVAGVLKGQAPDHLLVEGGATASAVCARAGFTALEAVGALSPGVITLRPGSRAKPWVTIKPGSYLWPDRLWNP